MRDAPDEKNLLALLRRVSRSFYLSMRMLPPELRRPVSVGYLLARTSDTIADAPGLPAAERLRLLGDFKKALSASRAPFAIAASEGMEPGERDLLDTFPMCIEWLNSLDTADRDDVLAVLDHITRGQVLDVERFGDASAAKPASLARDEQLDEYTYLVAGCVGEFWTRLGFRHMPHFASLPESRMLELGRDYGKALQLVNVLRDAGKDRSQGRCYLPDPANAHAWLARAEQGLEAGLRYSLALGSARMRVASALPALIGVRTVALLRAFPGEPVKVPRSEVRALLWRIAVSFGSRARIEREFRQWDNRAR